MRARRTHARAPRRARRRPRRARPALAACQQLRALRGARRFFAHACRAACAFLAPRAPPPAVPPPPRAAPWPRAPLARAAPPSPRALALPRTTCLLRRRRAFQACCTPTDGIMGCARRRLDKQHAPGRVASPSTNPDDSSSCRAGLAPFRATAGDGGGARSRKTCTMFRRPSSSPPQEQRGGRGGTATYACHSLLVIFLYLCTSYTCLRLFAGGKPVQTPYTLPPHSPSIY